MEPIYWLLIMVVFLVIEIITLGLTTIWFAGGSLVAFFAAFLGAGLSVQVGIFVAVSVVLLIFTRPIASRYFNRNTEKTNVDSLAGKTAVVTEDINNLESRGLVQMEGNIWSARSEGDEVLKAGTLVQVVRVKGVKLLVKRVEEA